MNPEQHKHLSGLTEFIENRVREKYTKGAEEHGGDLLTMTPRQLCLEAIDENLDQITYLYTLLIKLEEE